MRDTIYAPATAPGRAAVAVVRISGPQTARVVGALAGSLPEARRASLRRLRDAEGATLDRALVLWMPGPESFTGEDAAELHLHGGTAVVAAVLAALSLAGVRMAEAGEFTRRAFEGGKLDLVEAEGVADLVDAETEAQRRQALAQLGGEVSAVHHRWREILLESLAHLEAAVDFPDEDLPEAVAERAAGPLRALREELIRASEDRRGEQVREGLRIALIGAPNAGKSSLLNALAGRDAAIVAASPGTTRDVVEVRLMLAGLAATVADTAGLRASGDDIEREGVARGRRWAREADLRVWVVDGSAPDDDTPLVAELLQPSDIIVVNKRDLAVAERRISAWVERPAIAISAKHGDVQPLVAALERWACRLADGSEPIAATRERHRLALSSAAERIDGALAAGAGQPELMAEDIRLAARELERLTGRLDPEAVLERIFSSFCIGK